MIEYISLKSIDELLSIIGKAKSILPDIRSKDEVIFDEVVDPIFKEFQVIFDDYLMLFTLAIHDISNARTKEELKAASENLFRNRVPMLGNRVAIREQTVELTKVSKNKKLDEFLANVLDAFYSVEANPQPRKMSRSLESFNLLHEISSLERNDAILAKESAIDALTAARNQIEISFISAAQAHAYFRIRAKKCLARAARRQ